MTKQTAIILLYYKLELYFAQETGRTEILTRVYETHGVYLFLTWSIFFFMVYIYFGRSFQEAKFSRFNSPIYYNISLLSLSKKGKENIIQ
jgi:hypothetical protein